MNDSEEIKLTENAKRVLEKRYLAKNDKGEVIETPKDLFRRVAKNVAKADKLYDKKANLQNTEEDFYKIMANLEFLPNSPTLMNAGRELQQLSACFVLPIEDSMDSIFETIKDMAMIQKSGGGTGFSFSRLRPKNSMVKSTGGIASGPMSFLKVFNGATEAVKQGGCVDYNTIISTSKGLRPIRELGEIKGRGYQNIYLQVPTDNGIKMAEQWYNNGMKIVKTIIAKDGYEFTGTLNHKIRVIDKDGNYTWKRLVDVKKGDWVALQKDTFMGETVTFPEFNKKFHFNVKLCDIPEKMNKGLAELFGYYMGDGCYYKGKLMLAIPHDSIDLRDYFDEIVSNNFGIKSRYEQKPDDKSINNIYHSAMLVEWLKSIGVDKSNSKDASIPKVILEGDRICGEAFLRGLFEADGTINKEGYIRLYSISESLIKEVQILLLSLGIPSRISVNKNRKSAFGKNFVYNLRISTPEGLNLFKKRIGFVSKGKVAKLDYIKEKSFTCNDVIPNQSKKFREFYESLIIKPRNKFYKKIYHCLSGIEDSRSLTKQRVETLIDEYPFLENSFLSEFLLNNQYYDQVKEIRFRKTLTLDIVVPDSHTYIANGFVSHNTRRGANMGILRIDHPDILEFIKCKESDKEITNFNISVAVTEDFMKKVVASEDYDLIDPHTKKHVGKLNAKEVFNFIIKMAWKNGEPGIIFLDRMNKFNPTPELGEYESTNPCGEQILLPYESCNLGSINLSKMVDEENKKIDWDKLTWTTKTSVHFLDNVVDMNRYPLKKIKDITKANRKIGLGVMGFADMLIKLGIKYNSEEGLATARKVMGFILKKARGASRVLAKKRGAFPSFEHSIYGKSKEGPLRNATLTTIAPTGSLSIIAGCSSGVEPLFAVSYTRKILDNERFVEVHSYFKEIAEVEGFFSPELMKLIADKGSIKEIDEIPKEVKELFVTSHDILAIWHIKMQSAFQEYTDNAVSKTVNFPQDATMDDVRNVYMLAHKLGCKGVTIYRDKSREEQVLNIENSLKKKIEVSKIIPRPRPVVTTGTTTKVATGCGNLYVTINEDEQHLPFEVFMQMGKAGGCAMSQLEAIGRLVSLALRSGIDINSIIEQLKGIRCPNPSWEKGGRIFSCSDAIARVIERRLVKSKEEKGPKLVRGSGSKKAGPNLQISTTSIITKKKLDNIVGVCPDCGAALYHVEGCNVCNSCGYSTCG